MPVQDTFQSIAFSATRFTSFTAHAIIFGLVPICILVLRPAFASLNSEEWRDGRRRLAGRLEDLVQACVVASVTATVIGIILQAAILAGREGDITAELFGSIASTPFGRAYLIRLPLLAGVSVLLLNRVRQSSLGGLGDDDRGPTRAWWAGWTALGAVLLATSSFSGHAAVGNPRALSIGNDIVHLLSGATWFTGIVVLAALLPTAWKKKDEATRRDLLRPVVVRFSNVAVVSIILVAITGTINSLFDVGQLNDLIDEGYGIALSVKLVIFLAILALGGINHFYVRRRLERGAQSPVAALFKKTIAFELALGLTIMGVTGVLTGLQKTRESFAPRVPVSGRPTL